MGGAAGVRALLLGGIAAPVWLVLVVGVAAAMRPEYSHVRHFVSELGATGSPDAALMNYVGFVPVGLLVVGFGLALPRALPRGALVLASSLETRQLTGLWQRLLLLVLFSWCAGVGAVAYRSSVVGSCP